MMATVAGVVMTVTGVVPSAAKPAEVAGGRVEIKELGTVKIHSFLSGPDGLFVNSHIVEGPTSLIIFDGQLLTSYASQFADYVETLKKPVDRIILSHGHPDHWSGLEVLAARFSAAPIYALPGIAEGIEARGEKMLGLMRKVFGDSVAKAPTIPSRQLSEGVTVIDGIRFEFRKILDAESDLQLLALMPEHNVMFAFDVVFDPNDHAFTVANHFDHWIEILLDLDKIQGYEVIIIGHNRATNRGGIIATVEYLKQARKAFAENETPEGYAGQLKQAFPDRGHSSWADFSSKVLYLNRKRT
ncbi:hypothetical protein N185_16040 [Sinorhizobium sp. GW3]|nr:hypothetical protein N185_16040 [Sinorhizobium sp. GW3]